MHCIVRLAVQKCCRSWIMILYSRKKKIAPVHACCCGKIRTNLSFKTLKSWMNVPRHIERLDKLIHKNNNNNITLIWALIAIAAEPTRPRRRASGRQWLGSQSGRGWGQPFRPPISWSQTCPAGPIQRFIEIPQVLGRPASKFGLQRQKGYQPRPTCGSSVHFGQYWHITTWIDARTGTPTIGTGQARNGQVEWRFQENGRPKIERFLVIFKHPPPLLRRCMCVRQEMARHGNHRWHHTEQPPPRARAPADFSPKIGYFSGCCEMMKVVVVPLSKNVPFH